MEAVHRLAAPVVVQPQLMMIVAAVGVVMNGVIAALLWKSGARCESAQRLYSYGRGYAVDGGSDSGRIWNSADGNELD